MTRNKHTESEALLNWGIAIARIHSIADKGDILKDQLVVEVDPFLKRYTVARENQESSISFAIICRKRFWQELVINPENNFYYYWTMFLTLAFYYNIIVIIMRAVYSELRNYNLIPVWRTLDLISDFIYIVDSVFMSRLEFREKGIMVSDAKRLRTRYLHSWRFVMDVLALLPMQLLYWVKGVGAHPLLRLNRFLKIWRAREFFSESVTRTTFPIMFRLFFLILNILIVIHWNACIYYAISKSLGLGSDDWVYNDGTPARKLFVNKYLHCFYWSLLTLTAIGDTPFPEKPESVCYCIIDNLIGVMIFATIFGNIGSIINQMNASRNEFQHNVDAVKRYMMVRRIGKDLQDRVVRWFSYTWNNTKSMDDKQTLHVLPEKLRAEIAINVHLETLRRVSIFRDCEPGLLAELVLKLRLQVYSPLDYICKKGDIGKEMYILKRGKMEVVSDDGRTVFATLTDGAVFGELSILDISGSKTGNRRTASVRSVGYSDVFCLQKTDLWNALKEYTEAKNILLEKGKAVLRKDNLLEEGAKQPMTTHETMTYILREIYKMRTDVHRLRKCIDKEHMSASSNEAVPSVVITKSMEEHGTPANLELPTIGSKKKK